MKKMLAVCLFAVSLYAQAQTVETKPSPQPKWIKTYSITGMGFIDMEGQVVLNPEYDEIYPFGELSPQLAVIVQDDKMGLIDFEGTIIVQPMYDVITSAQNFNPNWLMVGMDSEYGFIDFEGNEVVPIVYDEFVAPNNQAVNTEN
jgi:WG containing repeat